MKYMHSHQAGGLFGLSELEISPVISALLDLNACDLVQLCFILCL